jgi:hypothetical protein
MSKDPQFSRSGHSDPHGKRDETLKTLVCERTKDHFNAHSFAEGVPPAEKQRELIEHYLFGAFSKVAHKRIDPGAVSFDDAISALACSSGVSKTEYVDQVIKLHVYGVVHAASLKGSEGG